MSTIATFYDNVKEESDSSTKYVHGKILHQLYIGLLLLLFAGTLIGACNAPLNCKLYNRVTFLFAVGLNVAAGPKVWLGFTRE